MKKLSINEFKKKCKSLKGGKIILHNDNQETDKFDYSLHYTLQFSDIQIHTNPNAITLKQGENTIQFSRVKHIEHNEISLIGEVFTIVCNGFIADTDIKHTIIIQC